jgi:hypothetical protein
MSAVIPNNRLCENVKNWYVQKAILALVESRAKKIAFTVVENGFAD